MTGISSGGSVSSQETKAVLSWTALDAFLFAHRPKLVPCEFETLIFGCWRDLGPKISKVIGLAKRLNFVGVSLWHGSTTAPLELLRSLGGPHLGVGERRPLRGGTHSVGQAPRTPRHRSLPSRSRLRFSTPLRSGLMAAQSSPASRRGGAMRGQSFPLGCRFASEARGGLTASPKGSRWGRGDLPPQGERIRQERGKDRRLCSRR